LAELEERGDAFPDVLRQLDAHRLHRYARDPAAMTAYLVEQKSADRGSATSTPSRWRTSRLPGVEVNWVAPRTHPTSGGGRGGTGPSARRPPGAVATNPSVGSPISACWCGPSRRRRGRLLGYAVAESRDMNADGGPVWFSGGTLARDLSLPQLQDRLPLEAPSTTTTCWGMGFGCWF
jgi:hypothetical protein